MLLSEQEALARLNSSSNLANRFSKILASDVKTIPLHRPGRKVGVPNISMVERNEIAFRAKAGEKQNTLANEFGLTQPRISQLANGNGSEEDVVQEHLGKVRDAALGKLMESLGLIDRDNLRKESASGLSRVASNLASVVERTMPKSREDESRTTVIVYAPELRKEGSFKVIDV